MFTINKEQGLRAKEWMDFHIKTKHKGNSYGGAIGGIMSYVFTGTGLGELASARCNKCPKGQQAEIDLTYGFDGFEGFLVEYDSNWEKLPPEPFSGVLSKLMDALTVEGAKEFLTTGNIGSPLEIEPGVGEDFIKALYGIPQDTIQVVRYKDSEIKLVKPKAKR